MSTKTPQVPSNLAALIDQAHTEILDQTTWINSHKPTDQAEYDCTPGGVVIEPEALGDKWAMIAPFDGAKGHEIVDGLRGNVPNFGHVQFCVPGPMGWPCGADFSPDEAEKLAATLIAAAAIAREFDAA